VNIVVEYSNTLIRRLEESLRSAFGQPSMLLGVPRDRGVGFHARLNGGSRTAHMDDGPNQDVAEIVVNQRHSGFWFTFDAAFTIGLHDQYTLEHAAIGVFHEIGTELVPFFRADWDKLDAEQESEHAQPHWHFVQRPSRIEGIVRGLRAASSQLPTEFEPEPIGLFDQLVDCGKVHFAMTSLWEKSEEPPYKKRLFDSDDFPKWFDSLTRYIAGEIAFIVGHMSLEDAPNVQAFSP